MVDALVLTGQRRNRKNKDFKKHKNSFCLELGWQAMRQRVYLRTFESARVATIPNQPIYFIEAQETTFQHLLSIFYAIIKDLLWLSCSFLIPTSHWLVSLHLLGTVTLKALLYLTAQPLSTNMSRTGTKLLLASFHLTMQSTTKRFLALPLGEVNFKSISSKTIKVLWLALLMSHLASAMSRSTSTKMLKRSKFGK